MRWGFGHEHFSAAAPDHDQAIELIVSFERPDVGDNLLGQLLLVPTFLDIRAVESFDVTPIEHCRPGADALELWPYLVEQRCLDDSCRARGRVAVVLENVPSTEHEVIESRQRHDVGDARRASLRPLPQTHRSHLRQRTDWLGNSFANGEHAGNRGGADGAEADEQHA